MARVPFHEWSSVDATKVCISFLTIDEMSCKGRGYLATCFRATHDVKWCGRSTFMKGMV
jgi:hypothetical protein